MQVGDVKFKKVWVASGAQGFFGEGYQWHRYYKFFGCGPKFDGMTFTAKTGTWALNKGNMALQEDFTPRDLVPDCIKVQVIRQNNLNAISLSNPGFKALINTGQWQELTEAFFLSFMTIGKTPEDRVEETRNFIAELARALPRFRAPAGLQFNISCPNTNHNLEELLKEAWLHMSMLGTLGIPIVPKLNALVAVEAARDLSQHPSCDALLVSNTIPFGQLPERIPWKKIYGETSPLARYGGGGYTGKYLLPIVLDWIRDARKLRITKPINGGGGIHSLMDAIDVFNAGADGISLGSIAMHRPYLMQDIVAAVNGS